MEARRLKHACRLGSFVRKYGQTILFQAMKEMQCYLTSKIGFLAFRIT